MLFVTISPKQAAHYAYICGKLNRVLNRMYVARKTLEAVADSSFDKSFAKCLHMLTMESLQCENEIRSHIDSLNCDTFKNNHTENKAVIAINKVYGVESACNYFENICLKSFRKLLDDKHIESSLKSLIQNHLQAFMHSLTQLRLFNDVKTHVN